MLQDPHTLLWLIPALLIGVLLGLLVGQVFLARQQRRYEASEQELRNTLELEKRLNAEKLSALEHARAQLTDTFNALSADALRHNNETFLKLAQEKLKQFQIQAEKDLQQKEIAIAHLVKPIQETLSKTEQQLHAMEKERKQSYGALSQHLESMARGQQQLQEETRNLVKALRRPEVRGQWGEMTLRRLVELAGMVEHCDFYEQETQTSREGAQTRPDMIVRLPAGRELIVDVKTPLDAYLEAMESADDDARSIALGRHARNLRQRVKELSAKAYWSQFKNAPDFVVLFIPGDQFLSAALDKDPALLEDAMQSRVVLATPTSLVALLRAVAYGWRQETLAENADRIRELGEELYRRVASFTEHMARLGKSLGNSVDQFNKAVGSLERQVLPGARKLDELGIQSKKDIPSLEPIEKMTRPTNPLPGNGQGKPSKPS